jgi:phage terminase large subunit GpA-like protein
MLQQEAEKWPFPEVLLESENGLDDVRDPIKEAGEEIIEDVAHARHPDLPGQQVPGGYRFLNALTFMAHRSVHVFTIFPSTDTIA